MYKKIAIVIGIVGVLCGAVLLVNYALNRHVMSNYEDEIYKGSPLTSVLGVTQPYIYHYNQGDIYYNQGDYAGAEQEFRKALEKGASGDRDCSIRINLALSMVAQIDEDSVTSDNLDDTIKILEEAKSILTENGCAHMDDEDGHSEDAQTLKDEIDEFEKKLKEQVNAQSEDEEEPEDNNSGDDSDSEDSTEEDSSEQARKNDIRQQLDDIQDDSLNQRNSEMDEYEMYKDGYSYYGGKSW